MSRKPKRKSIRTGLKRIFKRLHGQSSHATMPPIGTQGEAIEQSQNHDELQVSGDLHIQEGLHTPSEPQESEAPLTHDGPHTFVTPQHDEPPIRDEPPTGEEPEARNGTHTSEEMARITEEQSLRHPQSSKHQSASSRLVTTPTHDRPIHHPASHIYIVQHTDVSDPSTQHTPLTFYSSTNAIIRARQLWFELRYNLFRNTSEHEVMYDDERLGKIFEITDIDGAGGEDVDARVWVERCVVEDAVVVAWAGERYIWDGEEVRLVGRTRSW